MNTTVNSIFMKKSFSAESFIKCSMAALRNKPNKSEKKINITWISTESRTNANQKKIESK